MQGRRRGAIALIGLAAALGLGGCSIAPRDFFRSNGDTAPIVRARSVGMGGRMPDTMVVPTLIDKLNDPDAVVRMAAHEELRKRSGQDFGYAPWADAPDRARAVTAWKQWWSGERTNLARSQPPRDSAVVAAGYAEPNDRRAGLRRRFRRRATEPTYDGSAATVTR